MPERMYVFVCDGCGAQMSHASPCAADCTAVTAKSIAVVPAGREWWADFSDGDSIRKRVQVAHYHLRIAQDMADGRFGGPLASRRLRRRLGRAQQVVIKLLRLSSTTTQTPGSGA